MKRMLILIASMVTLSVMAGCMPHTTGETQVGVRTRKLTLISPKGVEEQVYAPGATYFFMPFINDWNVFDTKLQNLEMTFSKVRGDRRSRGRSRFQDHRRQRHQPGCDHRLSHRCQ